jgi:hypothetical protein
MSIMIIYHYCIIVSRLFLFAFYLYVDDSDMDTMMEINNDKC